MPTELRLVDIIGTRCLTYEDGKKVASILRTALDRSEKILIDCAKVTLFASPFFNAAIGSLLETINKEALRSTVTFANCSDFDKSLIDDVIEDASQYFSNPKIRDVVKNSIRELSESK